jgi:adenylate cyclase, class 2
MIEAELKARVRDPERARALLAARAAEEVSVYRDTYYDLPDRSLRNGDRELRVRIIERGDTRRCLLTYKDAAVDASSGSRPEHETDIGEASVMDAILRALGYEPVIAFTKHCANFTFEAHGQRVQATVVRLPELADTFLEVETLVGDRGKVSAALDVIRRVLGDLGITDADLTTELYTDMVAEHRRAVALPDSGRAHER